MAYLDLAFPEAASLAMSMTPFIAPARRLGPLDRRVLIASRRDGMASLRPPRGIARLFGALLGLRGANPLADPALEALRRYAVMLRHGGDEMAAEAAGEAVAAGYSVDQVAHARWLVAREGLAPPASLLVPATLIACAATIAIWFGMQTAHLADDTLIGLTISLVAIVSFAPLATRRTPRGGIAYV